MSGPDGEAALFAVYCVFLLKTLHAYASSAWLSASWDQGWVSGSTSEERGEGYEPVYGEGTAHSAPTPPPPPAQMSLPLTTEGEPTLPNLTAFSYIRSGSPSRFCILVI